MIDWVADYMDHGHDGPVLPQVKPGDVLAKLPEKAPQEGEPGDQLFNDFKEIIVPNLTHWGDRRFFAYFPCTNSYPSVLGELLMSGLDVNPFSWGTSPAATELEQRVVEWIGQILGLDWPGVLQDTGSTATLCSVLAAREMAADVNKKGFYDQKILTAYTSAEGHSSIIKGLKVAGIGVDNIRQIPTNTENFSIDTAALKSAIEEDIKAGKQPFMVIACVGTTSSTAVDDVEAIAKICKEHDIWLHVDAALAGTAALVPEMQWLMKGVSEADSFFFNPHKWMFTSLECTVHFVKDPYYLKRALAIEPEYLKLKHGDQVENYRDWIIQLGRRFKALKLWFVLRSFGVKGLQDKIRLHLEMTQAFAQKIKDCPDTYLVGDPKINTVCFRLDSDEASQQLMDAVNHTGEAFLTHSKLNGQFVIRAAFGQVNAEMADVEKLWSLITAFLPTKSAA